MNNIFNFSIVSSFLGLWISTHVPESFELILGFTLIFTFGMIHGSNDLLIINKLLKNMRKGNKYFVCFEMMDSLWYKQTPHRVKTLIKNFLNNE